MWGEGEGGWREKAAHVFRTRKVMPLLRVTNKISLKHQKKNLIIHPIALLAKVENMKIHSHNPCGKPTIIVKRVLILLQLKM